MIESGGFHGSDSADVGLNQKTIDDLPEGWNVQYNPKPIPDRRHDYDFWHDDFDDVNLLCGTAHSIHDAVEQILDNFD
mgnify:CR=1 FL=1